MSDGAEADCSVTRTSAPTILSLFPVGGVGREARPVDGRVGSSVAGVSS